MSGVSCPDDGYVTLETSPCEKCGKPRTKAEGGTTFTVCDECWALTNVCDQPQSELADMRAQIEALKAERDAWRNAAQHNESARNEYLKGEAARLEGLIMADHDTPLDSASCCGREASHAEAQAIKARQG